MAKRYRRLAPAIGEADSLASFLALVDQWVSKTSNTDSEIRLFRGQENHEWRLTPGIGRSQYGKRITENTESRMLAEFKQRGIPYLESGPQLDDADWLAIAQHHAMPTRLLDWTGSALAALWFAIKRPAGTGRDGEKAPAAVWMLAASESDFIDDFGRSEPLAITSTQLLKPRHVSRRITAQDGWFSIHPFEDFGVGPYYEALDANQEFKQRLAYIRVPARAFGPIRAQLQLAGINRGVLFPDLDGVAGRITDTFLYPEDQEPSVADDSLSV
ncbi:FRG domain-containing protein [Burkholderia gladioli]|uniref:FRG domain-containing protein n=1 Tax=Burkholderia gladioli TaxID=28095 RepID=UPI0034DB429E